MNLQHDHSCPFPSPYYYSSYYVKNPSTEKEMYEVSTYIHSYLVGNLELASGSSGLVQLEVTRTILWLVSELVSGSFKGLLESLRVRACPRRLCNSYLYFLTMYGNCVFMWLGNKIIHR